MLYPRRPTTTQATAAAGTISRLPISHTLVTLKRICPADGEIAGEKIRIEECAARSQNIPGHTLHNRPDSFTCAHQNDDHCHRTRAPTGPRKKPTDRTRWHILRSSAAIAAPDGHRAKKSCLQQPKPERPGRQYLISSLGTTRRPARMPSMSAPPSQARISSA